jgi:hypothetical protein
VSADDAVVVINDGSAAGNTGTYSDPDGNSVTLSASFGTVQKTGIHTGTWSWSSPASANSPGSRQVTITANDGLDEAQAQFTFTVNPIAPSVSLTSPANNALVRGSLPITATASDASGIQRVDFFVRGIFVDTTTIPPYQEEFDTTTIADGTATIAARATDNWGIQATASRTVTIDNTPPTIDVRAPTRKASAKANVTAHFSEAMNEGSVEAVDGVTGLPTTFVLKKGTKVVPATVSYDPNTQVATLDPTKKLRSGAKYVATVATAAKDEAGNPLAAEDTWSFRVK